MEAQQGRGETQTPIRLSRTTRVKLLGFYSHNECGYCGTGPAFNYSMRVVSMRAIDYQALMDRGWRRSGTFFYKPTMHKTCCPQYTIRLDSSEFHISKSQTDVLKRMSKFLRTGSVKGNTTVNIQKTSNVEPNEVSPQAAFRDAICRATNRVLHDLQLSADFNISQVIENIKVVKASRSKYGDWSSNAGILVSAALTRTDTPINAIEISNRIAAHLVDDVEGSVYAENGYLNLRLNDSSTTDRTLKHAPKTKRSRKGDKYDLASFINQESKQPEEGIIILGNSPPNSAAHVLTIETVPSSYTDELFELYKRYQIRVHDDEPEELSSDGFERFLVNSPLFDSAPNSGCTTRQLVRVLPDGNTVKFVPCDEAGNEIESAVEPPIACGSYHQLYRLDGTLIAVGVVDVTPRITSSVYCFYDPDLSYLSLGKFCALAEIQWCVRARRYLPEMQYYYMGFYVHSCPKMRYKGDFKPSQLLCPSTFEWYPLGACIPLLEQYRFTPLQPALLSLRQRIAFDPGPRAPKVLSAEFQGLNSEECESNVVDNSAETNPQSQNDDLEGTGSVESENEDSGSNPLEIFAPACVDEMRSVNSVPLDLNLGADISLGMLTVEGQMYLRPLLSDWVKQVGDQLASTITWILRES